MQHLKYFAAEDYISCPHPAWEVNLQGIVHFKNHAAKVLGGEGESLTVGTNDITPIDFPIKRYGPNLQFNYRNRAHPTVFVVSASYLVSID